MSESGKSDHQARNPPGDDKTTNEDQFDALFADLGSENNSKSGNINSSVEDDFASLFKNDNEDKLNKAKKQTLYDNFINQMQKYKYFFSFYDRTTLATMIICAVTVICTVGLIGYMVIIVALNRKNDAELDEDEILAAVQQAQVISDNAQQARASPVTPPAASPPSTLPPPPDVSQPVASRLLPLPSPATLDPDVVQPAPAPADLLAMLLKLENAGSTPNDAVMQALQNDPNKKVVTCMLERNRVIIANKPCNFSKTGTGDFMMTDTNQFRVIVSGTSQPRQIYWDNMTKGKEFKERGSISPDSYDKACWSNEIVRICAWR